MVLRDLFGREWEHCPGEKVVRIYWQDGSDGKPEGREVEVVAGDDPDPTCVFYELLSNAIEHRYRFFEPLPPPAPGEPLGINLPDVNWSRYIGLNERNDLASTIKPYLEDRSAHWQFVYTPGAPPDASAGAGNVSRVAAGSLNPSAGIGPMEPYVPLLLKILEKKTISSETWARDHKLGRSTVFDWKAARLAGGSLKGKVSDPKIAEIERAIKADAKALGLSTRTDSE